MPRLKRKSGAQKQASTKQRLREYRKDPDFRAREKEGREKAKSERKRKNSIDVCSAIPLKKSRNAATFSENRQAFLDKIKLGPFAHCSCCGGLWFPSSLKPLDRKTIAEKTSPEFVNLVFLDAYNDQHLFCFTCQRGISAQKVPRLSLSNGLHFPEIPPVLQGLTALEERLCSPRLTFLQIRSLGVDKQCGLRGNVVHIPNELDDTVGVLPRTLSESDLVPVQLLRHKNHDHSYLFQEIRPARVLEAAKYLITTPLYKEANVQLSTTWNETIQRELADLQASACRIIEDEVEQDVNPGGNETMIIETDNTRVVTLAPGHGKKPLPITKDLEGEILGYPTIYGGIPRRPTINLSYREMAVSEVRRKDRRCAVPHKVLHTNKILQNIAVKQAVQTQLRKSKNRFTAKDVLDEGAIKNLVANDLGFNVLRKVRGSPSFWEKKQKDLLAMIRQLGIPTLFVTLSAAETKWNELLIILSQILNNKADINVENMTYEEKADLIRRDPVTCARYFDYRLRQCFNHLLKPENGIFQPYKLKDYYSRIEFQHRGSPHAHMLLWLEGAPKFSPNQPASAEECVKFIDSLISCSHGVDDIIHQQHRHKKTCHKYDFSETPTCRFNFPKPPMSETQLLLPFPESFPKDVRESLKKNHAKIKGALEGLAKGKEKFSTFEELLGSLELSQEQYLASLRSKLKRPTVFLKRDIDSIETNAYIEKLGKLWKANMDAQFILDPYGCAKYVCSYISKSDGGVSKLLKIAAEEAASGKLKGIESLRKIGNTFLNCSEISAQEAVYGILGLPLTKSSRECVFIPTGPPNERIKILKSRKELETLDLDSEDIYVTGLLEHYSLRPLHLEQTCLADFASQFQFFKTKTQRNKQVDEEQGDVPQEFLDTSIPLLNNRGFIRQRKTPKIIRFVRYGERTDPENFYREQITLYWPWRNEENDVLIKHWKTFYQTNIKHFEEMSAKYNQINIDKITEEYSSIQTENNDPIDKEYECMFDEDVDADFSIEFGQEKISIPERLPAVPFLPDGDFEKLILNLNERQTKFVSHVLRNLDKQIFFKELVYGGAGVGKSVLIKALVQCVLRLSVKLGDDPSSVKLLLACPTGKAAFNIQGGTLHSTFFLPISQYSGPLGSLPDDQRNSLQCHLKNLRLIIIDEVSMMSGRQLDQISRRMRQLFDPHQDFGGIPVILVGDLRQLGPVRATYVFTPVKSELQTLFRTVPLWESFQSFELTEIMRQKDDAEFALALNHLSRGVMTEADIALIRNRQFQVLESVPRDAIHVFGKNEDVDRMNASVLASLGITGNASAVDVVQGKGSMDSKQAILDRTRELPPNKTMNLYNDIELAIGAKYMLTVNVDVSDGLTNGATGILRQVDFREHVTSSTKRPHVIWLEFSDLRIGQKRRKLGALRGLKNGNLVPIWRETREVLTWPASGLSVVRKQFPVTPSEAITVWKAQGDTYDNVVAYTKGLSRKGLYVAFSRAKKADGLFIVGAFKPPLCSINDTVEIEMRKIKKREIQLQPNELSNADIITLVKSRRTALINKGTSAKATDTLKPNAENHDLPAEGTRDNPVELPIEFNFAGEQSLVVHFPGRYGIQQVDLDTLRPGEWLSTVVVDAYIDCVKHRNQREGRASVYNFESHFQDHFERNREHIFETDWSSALQNEFLIFPRCYHGHWTVAIADRANGVISGYDSFNSSDHLNYLQNVESFLEESEERYFGGQRSWIVRQVYLPEASVQKNSYDCGIYVCLVTDFTCRRLAFNMPRALVGSLRSYVRDCVLGGNILPISQL